MGIVFVYMITFAAMFIIPGIIMIILGIVGIISGTKSVNMADDPSVKKNRKTERTIASLAIPMGIVLIFIGAAIGYSITFLPRF